MVTYCYTLYELGHPGLDYVISGFMRQKGLESCSNQGPSFLPAPRPGFSPSLLLHGAGEVAEEEA